MAIPSHFIEALLSPHRNLAIPNESDLFGFLVGEWELDAVLYDPSGQTRHRKGELHAAWVLEGRAIQDLFIFPRRADRNNPVSDDRYATTIRTFDPPRNAWRIDFINPAAPDTSAQLMARRQGTDIVMEGKLAGGTAIRWQIDSITPTTYHYFAERSTGAGEWKRYLELFGRRPGSAVPE